MEFQQIKEWANDPMVCISGIVKENIDTLIAAVESLTAEKEAAEKTIAALRRIYDQQADLCDKLKEEKEAAESSLAQAREEIAELEKENTELRVLASEESHNLMLAEQREKGLREALELLRSYAISSISDTQSTRDRMQRIQMLLEAALAAASKEEACEHSQE